MRRFAFAFVGFVIAAACSSSTSIIDPPSDDIAVPVDARFDLTVQETSTIDTGTPFNGGGPFVCFDCVCDGTLDFCGTGGGGGAPVVDASDDVIVDAESDASDDADADDGAAGMCSVADAGVNGCVTIPLGCLPKPTCACLSQHFPESCTCSVDSTGNGFHITCPPNP